MKNFTYTIQDPEGIHARPAGLLVKAAAPFKSKLTMEANGKTGDLKRLFGLMALGVKNATTVTLTAEGEDEEAAIAAVSECLKTNL